VPRPEARIVDEEGADVKPGNTGELLIRTPTLMLGYFRDPQQTQAAFLDGWFRTGDLVSQGEDGFFRFVARKKDIIRRRGENIAAAEIERVLLDCPGVADVAVIGVPSELGEEEILAAVVRKADATTSAPLVGQWVAARLTPAKVPRFVAFVDAIPYTPTHKAAKHRLKEDRDLLAGAIDLSAAAP
jgi:carnitine-CoA ligase